MWSRCQRSLALLLLGPSMCLAANVTTHHYDNFRTGWNWQESALTPAFVRSGVFTNVSNVAVDEQIDAQPLVLTNQSINGGPQVTTVVYVATENNTVYAIDGATGAILGSNHLESPFSVSTLSNGSCNNNSSVVGINSTPVIDAGQGTLYVVTTFGSGIPSFHLHALSVSTLADKVSPLTIANPYSSSVNRQRSALTLFHGGVLIPFSSFCDHAPSRGFLVYANTNASPASQVAFQTSASYLGSVWMSGGGPVISGSSIYFSTGNGNQNGPYPPGVNNLVESLVKLQGSAGVPLSLAYVSQFTPANYAYLDNNDLDFGAGSVLMIPQGAPTSIVDGTTVAQFVTAIGKDGSLYVNGLALGSSYIQDLNVGADCHCNYSYFTGSDSTGHVAMSAGETLGLYNVSASGLTFANSNSVTTGIRTDGFSTSVSSNGAQAGTGIIWAVSGPTSASGSPLVLSAYDAGSMAQLFSTSVGAWPNTGGYANSVPVVSNGKVLVASYKQLSIFGNPGGDQGTMTEGSYITTAGNAEVRLAGFESSSPAFGSYSPTMLTGGKTLIGFYDYAYCTNPGGSNPPPTCPTSPPYQTLQFYSNIVISGFTSDPGAGWLISATALGVTRTGASASYSYSGGTATWSWGSQVFGFTDSGTTTCSILHH